MREKYFSSPSLGNIKFSYTDANFYKKKKEKKQKKKIYSISEYKDLFKNYYKNKNNNNIDSLHEINNYYLKCQKNLKNYFSNDKNAFGLKFEGNKKLQNYSLDKFNNIFNKACSAREQILQNKILNYYYPKDNDDKLMGKKMKLTPIPVKKDIFLKNENEKKEYLKAKRSAVCMRRLEYTHGLRRNNSQEFINNSYFNDNYKNDFLDILKGAILIIEDWWIGILNKRYYFNEIYEQSKIEDDNIISPSERDSSMNSIEQNILRNLNSNNNNIAKKNDMINNWIYKQSQKIIEKKENNKNINNNYNISKTYNRKSLNQEREKRINKTNRINPIMLKNKNNSNLLFNSNRRYMNISELKKSKTIKSKKSIQQYPIKIIQNSEIPNEYKDEFQTIFTPSNYLQNYFNDYCLNNNLYNAASHGDLKSFEFIQKKNQNNNNKQKYINLSSSENDKNIIINHDEFNEEQKEPNNILRGRKKNVKKDLSSEIEPIHQDDIINIINNEDLNTKNNNNYNNIYKYNNKYNNDDNIYNYNNHNKNNKYNIKYNIIKSQSKDGNNNINNSERSSMDGSVDEIITRKLKEIHEKNEKYTQRILKAYNQVKFFKTYSIDKNAFINNHKKNNFFQTNQNIKYNK